MTSSDPGHPSVRLADSTSAGRPEWEAATARVLRRAGRLADDDPDEAVWSVLATTTLDDIVVPPLGDRAQVADLAPAGLPGQPPFVRGVDAELEVDGWDVRAWFTDPETDRTLEHVRTDLENGVTSLWLSAGDGAVPRDAFAEILAPVYLDLAPVVVDDPDDPLATARALDAVLAAADVTPAPGTSFGADPLAARVRGRGETGLDVLAPTVDLAVGRGIRGVVVDATCVHDAGGSDAQELGYLLAAGATYLRALVEHGLDVASAADQIDVRLAVTDEQFPSIAKLRAARRGWDRMLQLSGVDPARRGLRTHAVTSRPMLSAYDPYVNLLRTTVATFAAAVGGAQAITSLPFDEPLGLPEPFSRRLARNVSAVLIGEAHVGRVTDPAGGAFLVERLTDDMARAAWAVFAAIEEAGGLPAGLDGFLDDVRGTAETREESVATRRRPLTGLTEFPALGERRPTRRPYTRAPLVRRWGAAFEALRDEPAATPVFLATMGSQAQYTARATFITNLLAAGGVDVVGAGPSEGVDDVLVAYAAAGSPAVAVLVGSEEDYVAWGEPLATRLREAGAEHLIVTGRSRALTGVDDEAATGLDALAFLRRTREALR